MSLYTHCVVLVKHLFYTRIDIIYVYHVFVANRLTGVQMGIFTGENGCSFVLQEITAFMSENICMKNKF